MLDGTPGAARFLGTSVTRLNTPLLNETEMAQLLGVQPATLQAWRLRGGGPPFVKINRLVRYNSRDVEAWLLTRKRSSTSDAGE